MKRLKLISGNSNPSLTHFISSHTNIPVCDVDIDRFKDGEIRVEINESVRGHNVFVVQSTSAPANENIMELLILIDALIRANAKRVIVFIPYYGYSRQDRRPGFSRTPISSRLIADLLEKAGVDEIVLVDIHSEQQQGFFHVPTTNVSANPLFLHDIKTKYGQTNDKVTFVSPDVGGVARTRSIAKKYNDADLAIIDKRRPKANVSEVMNIIGNVQDKHCILVDDLVDTAGTLCKAAEALKKQGAISVDAYCTHGVFSGDDTFDKIEQSSIDQLVITNSIPYDNNQLASNIKILDLSALLSKTMRRIIDRESVSKIYK